MLVQIVVVFMSLGFIGFVTLLHIVGKVRGHESREVLHLVRQTKVVEEQQKCSQSAVQLACMPHWNGMHQTIECSAPKLVLSWNMHGDAPSEYAALCMQMRG